MDDELGTCDFCQQPVGERGWMVNTGETMHLDENGPLLPIVKIYCSERCKENTDA